MGYSANVKKIEKMRPYLELLLKTDVSVSWNTPNPHMLAYYIREAMTIASKDSASPFKKLKSQFTIRNKGDRVLAERREEFADIMAELARPKMILEGIKTLPEVLGASIMHNAHEMYFPDAELSRDHVTALNKWCENNNYNIVVGDGITVTRDDPGEAKWTE